MFVLVDREEKRTALQFMYLRAYAKVVEWFDVNSFPFLIGGLIINTYFLFNVFSPLNAFFECLYGVVIGYKIINALRRRKQTGSVVDATTNQPLDLATIRIAKDDRFVQVRVTDKSGLFFVLLPAGNYTVFCSKGGYETTNKKLFVPNTKKVKVVKLDFSLRKLAV